MVVMSGDGLWLTTMAGFHFTNQTKAFLLTRSMNSTCLTTLSSIEYIRSQHIAFCDVNSDVHNCHFKADPLHSISTCDHPDFSLTHYTVTWPKTTMFCSGPLAQAGSFNSSLYSLPRGPRETIIRDVFRRAPGWTQESVTCLCKEKMARHIQAWGQMTQMFLHPWWPGAAEVQ